MSDPGDFIIENGVLTKYVGPGGDVVIPEGVTEVGDIAFHGNTSLTQVVIPDSVKSIGSSAFNRCSNLTSVVIPESVTNISEYAFFDCCNLESVSVPDGVTSIGPRAFYGCSKLADAEGFVIVKNRLFDYKGSGGDVVIPECITEVSDGVLYWCSNLTSVTIPESVKYIGDRAFSNCSRLKSVTIPAGVTKIGKAAFCGCANLTSVTISDSVTNIGKGSFSECSNLTSFTVLGKLSEIPWTTYDEFKNLTELYAPHTPHAHWRNIGLGMVAAKSFVKRSEIYTDPDVYTEYITYLSSQRKKLLPDVFQLDKVDILEKLVKEKKITKKNIEAEYLLLARQSQAAKCIALLEELASAWGIQTEKKPINTCNELWDGIHFSLDGKKLLKCPEMIDGTVYRVPEGTKEIGKAAFCFTQLKAVYLSDSVTVIRNGAFVVKRGKTLFVSLPASLKALPSDIFDGRDRDGDDGQWDGAKTFYAATPVKELAEDLCMDSYSRGNRRMVYTGGLLDDLPTKTKKFAVEGFLYAEQHKLADLSPWRSSYLDHIKRGQKTYIGKALENEFLLRLMLDEALITDSGAKMLLEAAETQGRADLKAEILAYRDTKLGGKKQRDDFSFVDSDQELKRREKLAARQEQIKEQKGIKGLAFVSSGGLKHFGEYNEYTEVFDLSDLKAFIEACGGFYRGAVSSKTDYLICNDPNSNSTKSQKAKELGVPVITEEEFLKMANETE